VEERNYVYYIESIHLVHVSPNDVFAGDRRVSRCVVSIGPFVCRRTAPVISSHRETRAGRVHKRMATLLSDVPSNNCEVQTEY
jgi:hypothetical protein